MQSVQTLIMTDYGVFGVTGAARVLGMSRVAGVFGMSGAGVYAHEVNNAWIVPLPIGMA